MSLGAGLHPFPPPFIISPVIISHSILTQQSVLNDGPFSLWILWLNWLPQDHSACCIVPYKNIYLSAMRGEERDTLRVCMFMFPCIPVEHPVTTHWIFQESHVYCAVSFEACFFTQSVLCLTCLAMTSDSTNASSSCHICLSPQIQPFSQLRRDEGAPRSRSALTKASSHLLP